jgi:DnaA-homolog protein
MKQLALTLTPPPAPALDNFFPGRNGEILSALSALASGSSADRCFFLWGEAGSGRSHLLRATIAALQARGVPALYVADAAQLPAAEAGVRALAVDDVQRLDAGGQAAFFNLFNFLRESHGILLATGDAPPARLPLRPDIVTRLGWGLVYQVHALSDDEKASALKGHAAARSFNLPDEVIDYLLRHLRRDLRSLVGTLDALDRFSLETKRPITLPLLRELLQSDAAFRRSPSP